ncbi:hypothetical protein D3C73_1015840 [compost metagenome]
MRIDAFPRILHRDFDHATMLRCRNNDTSVLRMLNRVVQQIADNLAQAILISERSGQMSRDMVHQPNVAFDAQIGVDPYLHLHSRADIRRCRNDAELALFQFGII